MSNCNKSALTDHTTTENHEIDWEGVQIIDRKPNKIICKQRKPSGSER